VLVRMESDREGVLPKGTEQTLHKVQRSVHWSGDVRLMRTVSQ
jgi:hypothetical protein